ncbi:hypothetical protein Sta7437_1227 [Stanieria cyanosphaera PCC 7437]|uniref:Peptidase C39-like domain-containing protein n=1 Tax=Stanieria cyanosphaera (strain ATCC 29371 / PCC 7437) TaxID=111780 RepID=K9XSZ9_STAC7|nr:hypothetical protein [Stanieria cyanosphaera]AFZ34797.1 hypothetical protein Sta7437_1227 [Stanieria cyanosphaera PCC 7437]
MTDFIDLTEVSKDVEQYTIAKELEAISGSNFVELVDADSEDFLFDFEPLEINSNELIESNFNINQDFLGSELSATFNDELTGSNTTTGYNTNNNLGYSSQYSLWGTPKEDAYYWRKQQGSTTCAIVAQISIYESITGKYIAESNATKYAQAKGWFDPNTGTSPTDSDNILNVLGIKTKYKYQGDIYDIVDALNNGDKIIAGVDGKEIWNPIYSTVTGKPLEQINAGHAVWVTGIVQYADKSIDFILNDSGTSLGKMDAVDYWDFMNAWSDYSNFLIVVDA